MWFSVIFIVCDDLLNLPNGTVSTNGTRIGDIATYSCDDGYKPIGNGNATCQQSGHWSVSPACKG